MSLVRSKPCALVFFHSPPFHFFSSPGASTITTISMSQLSSPAAFSTSAIAEFIVLSEFRATSWIHRLLFEFRVLWQLLDDGALDDRAQWSLCIRNRVLVISRNEHSLIVTNINWASVPSKRRDISFCATLELHLSTQRRCVGHVAWSLQIESISHYTPKKHWQLLRDQFLSEGRFLNAIYFASNSK